MAKDKVDSFADDEDGFSVEIEELVEDEEPVAPVPSEKPLVKKGPVYTRGPGGRLVIDEDE